jgi:ribosome maturation factor RimP
VEDLTVRLQELVKELAEEHGAELVDLQIKGRPGSQIVKVFVDTDSGITLEKCEKISRELSDILDIEDIMPGKYILEVSSPGVSRPLRNAHDFRRNLNKDVEVIYRETDEERSFNGIILEATDDSVLLQGEGEMLRIPIATIQRGKINLPW